MSFLNKVFDRRKCKFKFIWLFLLILCTSSILFFNYCFRRACAWNDYFNRVIITSKTQVSSHNNPSYNFTVEELDKRTTFNAKKDVFIFVHIQKTGGSTFGEHLVKNSHFKDAHCNCIKNHKRCKCRTAEGYQWLFSRLSTGWMCGLHADWTELHSCAAKYLNSEDGLARERRYLYMTILREPVSRYISEWRHVQRGSTWSTASLRCGGRRASKKEVPLCYKGEDWSDVSFEDFVSCPHNLAHNRQTRMLSDLTLVGCYKRPQGRKKTLRDNTMLSSAMENLKRMPFFGLTEFQTDTQFLFEHTFGLKFSSDFSQMLDTHASRTNISISQRLLLIQRNHLDIQLYHFAKELFHTRVKYARMQQQQQQQQRQQQQQKQQQQQQQAVIGSSDAGGGFHADGVGGVARFSVGSKKAGGNDDIGDKDDDVSVGGDGVGDGGVSVDDAGGVSVVGDGGGDDAGHVNEDIDDGYSYIDITPKDSGNDERIKNLSNNKNVNHNVSAKDKTDIEYKISSNNHYNDDNNHDNDDNNHDNDDNNHDNDDKNNREDGKNTNHDNGNNNKYDNVDSYNHATRESSIDLKSLLPPHKEHSLRDLDVTSNKKHTSDVVRHVIKDGNQRLKKGESVHAGLQKGLSDMEAGENVLKESHTGSAMDVALERYGEMEEEEQVEGETEEEDEKIEKKEEEEKIEKEEEDEKIEKEEEEESEGKAAKGGEQLQSAGRVVGQDRSNEGGEEAFNVGMRVATKPPMGESYNPLEVLPF